MRAPPRAALPANGRAPCAGGRRRPRRSASSVADRAPPSVRAVSRAAAPIRNRRRGEARASARSSAWPRPASPPDRAPTDARPGEAERRMPPRPRTATTATSRPPEQEREPAPAQAAVLRGRRERPPLRSSGNPHNREGDWSSTSALLLTVLRPQMQRELRDQGSGAHYRISRVLLPVRYRAPVFL